MYIIYGFSCEERGEYTGSLRLYEKSLSIDKQNFGEKSAAVAVYNNIGNLHRNRSKYLKAL